MGDRKSSARPAGDPSPRRKALRAVGIAAAAVVFGAGLYQIYGWIVLGIGWYRMNRGAVHTMLIAAAVVNGLRARRVLISASGPAGNVLKIRPPLVFSPENADLLLETLGAVLGKPS